MRSGRAMDFGALPPEINSARMYTGPGAGSMVTAAAAWDCLADEISLVADSHSRAVSGLLAGPWQGAGAQSMAATATTYAAWLNATAAQVHQTAGQARAAVSAYETAYAMTVPPAVIAANRALLAALVATNVLGQNAAAISAAEIEYCEMWAQDATAMYGYAAASSAAATLTPFAPPPRFVDPGGLGGRAAAAAHSAAALAGTQTRSEISFLILSAIRELSSLATPGAVIHAETMVLNEVRSGLTFANPALTTVNSLFSAAKNLVPGAAAAKSAAAVTSTASKLASAPAGLEHMSVSAELGGATRIGAMSAPPSWAVATPPAGSAVNLADGAGAAVAAEAGATAGVPAGAPLPMASRTAAGNTGGPRRFQPDRPMLGRLICVL
ncbi:PPE family protein [Mycobacterium sp. TY813]|nr:PPE family protein [Mycobacterium sp. TY813]MDP7732167.1 PPE family protein [Mycobacterium sp. TY813]